MSDTIKAAFEQELRKSEAQLDLALAALYLAQYLTESFDTQIYVSMLDDIAAELAPRLQNASTAQTRIEKINDFLFEERGFAGNFGDYYNPHNSFLNRVLELRRGIPISLSVVYLEIGQRLDLPVWGIGMPRHFIVGYGSVDNPFYIDVFDGGALLSLSECVAIAGATSLDPLGFKEKFLKPVTKKSILYRMLLNLKHIYLGRKEWEAAYKAIDLMVEGFPTQLTELKDRGLLAYRLNRLRDALFDLNRYLYLAPADADTDWLQQRVELIEEQLLRLN